MATWPRWRTGHSGPGGTRAQAIWPSQTHRVAIVVVIVIVVGIVIVTALSDMIRYDPLGYRLQVHSLNADAFRSTLRGARKKPIRNKQTRNCHICLTTDQTPEYQERG